MLLVIDNYDSFTYNLVQYLGELGATLKIVRNDKIDLRGIQKLRPKKIVISPGPGSPKDAGISVETIKEFSGKIPLLGVCLGHQAIAYAFGGKIVHARRLMHGKTSEIFHNGKGLFRCLPNPFTATRYHSLVAEKKSFPVCLEITARTKDGEIMGLKHKTHPTYGVQFHPESILTADGKKLLQNFTSL